MLIDCAPALDQITVNALTASHGAAVVTEASLFSTDGLAQLIRTIATVRQHYNATLNIAGIIVNRYDAREKGVRAAMDELTEGAAAHGLSLLEPHIPKRAAIRDAIRIRDRTSTMPAAPKLAPLPISTRRTCTASKEPSSERQARPQAVEAFGSVDPVAPRTETAPPPFPVTEQT